LRVMGELWA